MSTNITNNYNAEELTSESGTIWVKGTAVAEQNRKSYDAGFSNGFDSARAGNEVLVEEYKSSNDDLQRENDLIKQQASIALNDYFKTTEDLQRQIASLTSHVDTARADGCKRGYDTAEEVFKGQRDEKVKEFLAVSKHDRKKAYWRGYHTGKKQRLIIPILVAPTTNFAVVIAAIRALPGLSKAEQNDLIVRVWVQLAENEPTPID